MESTGRHFKRKTIEGTVILKRKAYWVKRYAQIKDNMFQYKKEKSKAFPKGQ